MSCKFYDNHSTIHTANLGVCILPYSNFGTENLKEICLLSRLGPCEQVLCLRLDILNSSSNESYKYSICGHALPPTVYEPLSQHLLPFFAIILRKVIVTQNTQSSTIKDVS
jgi:hypothetical protein